MSAIQTLEPAHGTRKWCQAPRVRKRHTGDLNAILSISRRLFARRRETIGSCFHTLARFLDRHGTDFLAPLIRDASERRALLGALGPLDHVGFLAPAHAEKSLSAAARAAGFDQGQRGFPSRIVARELGPLIGRPILPTTVFRAERIASTGANVAVEVFLPCATATRRVAEWVQNGPAVHLAFLLTDRSSVGELAHILARAGFRPPPFMKDGPLTNEAERVTALYFDGRFGTRPLRLELCL